MPTLHELDGKYPPFAPIPGRGIPLRAAGEIPTRPVYLLRAGVAFGTSLTAAAGLAIRPAVIIATVGDGGVVLASLSPGYADGVPVTPARNAVRIRRWCLRDSNTELRACPPAMIPQIARAPRGRFKAAPLGAHAAAARASLGASMAAASGQRLNPIRSEVSPPPQRPRPPPGGARAPPSQLFASLSTPIAPPLFGRCGSAFSFPFL